jgi:hypothetical protein
MLVSPPGKRFFRSSCTFVESASLGRKLAVSSLVTSATFAASGDSAKTATIHSAITTHFVRRPQTKVARADMRTRAYTEPSRTPVTISTPSPIGSQRKRLRMSSGAPASARSTPSRPSRKCRQPS